MTSTSTSLYPSCSRSSTRETVERAPLRLRIKDLATLLGAPPRTHATISIGNENIAAEVVVPLPGEIAIRLRYEFRGEAFDVLLVVLEITTPVATRLTWACPVCSRRCHDLYRRRRQGNLACRRCLGLSYASQGHQPRAQRLRRAQAEAARWEARLVGGRLRAKGRLHAARRLQAARERLTRLRAEAMRVASRAFG